MSLHDRVPPLRTLNTVGQLYQISEVFFDVFWDWTGICFLDRLDSLDIVGERKQLWSQVQLLNKEPGMTRHEVPGARWRSPCPESQAQLR